ncbi:DNA binding domain-containing protein, excisionase family [Granulicella rosea]|uniref:DNA binding domain-containing protein, excisionase family n=1 Tax=Granulicella rosea TaxID=474952 RepID=A0A239MLC8_9BACT|nr:excisionase family DNA-binding protein [Granulicella rosea]SNT43516.1 DNA binding domain-containing protein, excisionase family [Granulicella rosea]
MSTRIQDPISLPAAASDQVNALHNLLRQEGKAQLVGKGGEPAIELPDAVFDLLVRIVEELQQGKAISIVPVTQDLTTQQAAEMLGVSRPYFVKLLEMGQLPFHSAGTHRRVYLQDLLVYKRQRDRQRREALDEMGREADEQGAYGTVLLPVA